MSAIPPSNACIEPAWEADLPALAELAAIIWRACYPGIIPPEQIDYMLSWMYSPETLREELRGGIRFDRLLVDGEFVGFSSYGPTDVPAVFKLHKLYLHSRLHGQGFGRLLLDRCEAAVRRLGGHRLILNVNKRNEKAIKAYLRSGFHVVDSVVANIGGGFVMDDHVMAKEIASPVA